MIKEHDYFLELMSNPTFSPKDFQLVGLNSENTGIQDKAKYKNSQVIQDNLMFQTNGKFDEAKFDRAYEQALYQYNDLARLSQAEKPFFRDDIFAPKELRGGEQPEFEIQKVANPLRQKQSFVNFGIKEDPTMSVREIAEANPVFDYKTGKWTNSPNETWFDNFINPKVLAQWDFDADENGNPTNNPNKIVYHKGEKKIDPTTGTYYYETLGNRDIYGREVLSGFDTLTTDGSVWNKYDFFDSDDREKSLTGSLTRAVAQIAPVFIPYVGEAYIGTRIGLSMAQLIPTIGKVFTGSDNSFLSKIEGINQAFSFSTSDRTQGSAEAGIEADPWTMETGLKLISDVFTQLAEQRWIFKYGNALFSRVNPKMIGETEEAVAARETWINANAAKQGFTLEGIKPGMTPEELKKAIDTEQAINYLRAKTTLDKTLKHGQELSKHLSMAYMTGITTADSYGEAKQQGASDIEAALFALGYTAGEYTLLSSDLGQWILPELKMEKFQNRQIAKALSKVTREAGNVNEPTGQAKQKWYKQLFNYGKQLATQDYSDSVLTNASKMTVSAMLSEGAEEVSEEALLDMSKTLFNAANALRGDDTRFDDAWKDMATRYGMSFIGGTVGGGIATALPGYRAARSGRTVKDSEAYKQLVHIVQNGQGQEFIDTVNKMELGNRDLSMNAVQNSDGTTSYKPAENYEDSQDYFIKQKLIEQVNMIDNILQSEGAKISDDSLLNDKLIRKELKYHSLLQSNVLGVYTNEFNNLLSDLIDTSHQIDELESAKSGNDAEKTDTQNRQDKKNFTKEDENKLKELKKQQKELRDKLEMYRNGSMANEFIGEALFEMDSHISAAYAPTDFMRWAEEKSGKKFTELSDTDRNKLEKEWQEGNISRRESVHRAYQVFKQNQVALSNLIKKFEEDYFTENKGNTFKALEDIFLGNGGREATLAQSADIINETASWIPLETRLAIWDGLLKSIKGSISESDYNNLKQTFDNLGQTYEQSVNLEKLPQTIEELNALSPDVKQALLDDLQAEEEPKEDKDLVTLINTRKQEYDSQKMEDSNTGWASFIADPLVQKEFINKLKEAKYLTPTTKQYIRDFINRADVTEETVKELNDTLNSISNSPIEELLTNMKATLQSVGIDTTGMITDLSKFMSDLANSANIENFSYSEQLDQNIRKTLDLIDIAHSHIEAAKTEIYGDLNNFFGYNASINELQEKYPIEGQQQEKLVELKSDTANSLMYELAKIYNDLKFYQAVYNANTNAKLTDHIKTDLKLNTLYFGNLKNWSVEIPDDWDGKDKINEAINNATTLQSIIDNKKESLTLDERKQLFQERLNIDQSIYDFFQLNKAKLQNSKEIAKLLTSFNLLAGKKSILNSGTEAQDSADFIWNLASLAASNPTAVYNEYKNSITGKYAPIIAQEEAVRRAYSYILNPKVFEAFGEAYNEVYKQQLQEARQKSGNTHTDFDTDEYLMSMRHFLIEGVPGSGKTSATFTMLHNMLKQYHPELLKKVWFISNSKQNANNASSEIGIEGVTTMSKEEYFNKIANNYSQKYDSYGVIDMSANDVEEDENGINHYKGVTLNEEIEAPSLIFFDEVSSFSQQDLLLSEDFLKAKGIYAFAAGDFDQIGAQGKFKDANDEDVFVRLSPANFIGSWKLGSSMRSNNTYKSKNISVARENIKEYPKLIEKYANGESGINPIKFAYYEALDGPNKGLYGDKVVRSDEPQKWEQSVKNMLDSLNEGEKLNFISDDPSTELYQALKALNEGGQYKDKINFVQAGASQGQEGQYYVIELSQSFEKAVNSNDSEAATAFGKTIYTTISRAKQGSLIVGNYDADTDTPLFQSIPQTTLQVNNLSPQILQNFANDRIDILSNALGSSDVKTELIRDNVAAPDTQQDSTSGENPSGDDITEEEVKTANNDRPNKIENKEEGKLNLMMHSFMCQETGCDTIGGNEPTDSTTQLKLGRYFDQRIDNLNGLAQIDKRSNGQITIPGVQVDQNGTIVQGKGDLLKILNRIRNLSCYIKDKNDLVKAIQDELGTDVPIKINFAYKNQYRSYKSDAETQQWFDQHPEYQKFYKGKSEYLAGIFNESNTGQEIREPKDQVIEAIITLQDGTQLLEVPLCKITSPLTLLNTSEFEGLKQVFDGVNQDVAKFKREIKKLLQQNSNIPHIKEYAMLLELYEGSAYNTISYFANDFTLAKVAKVTGITTTSSERGADYFKTLQYYYDGKWMSLEDYKQRMPWRKMSKIFTSVQQGTDVVSINGNDINVGKPFVLVSDYYSNSLEDSDMLNLYLQQLNNPNSTPLIRLVYVTPPSATIPEYVFNLNNALTRHKGDADNIDRDLGTKVTAFRLLQFALAKNSEFRTAFTDWVNNSSQANKQDFISRLEAVSNIVTSLTQYESKEGRKKLYDLLNLPIRSLDSNTKGLLKYSDSTGDKWLMSTSSNLTLRHVLQQELHKMLLSDLFYGDSLQSNILQKQDGNIVFPNKVRSKIDAFINDATKGGWNGVQYHLKLRKDSTISVGSQSLQFAEIDTEYGQDYSVSGKPIQINGKLDATSFVLDIVPFAKWVIKGGLGRNPDAISTDTSSNIFAESETDKKLKDTNTRRYLEGEPANEPPTEDKTFVDMLNKAKFPSGMKRSNSKTLSEAFANLTQQEKQQIISDPREFLYNNTNEHLIAHTVNNELKLFNFGNTKNVIFLNGNVLFQMNDDSSKVYKLDIDGKAIPVTKEEFIQMVQGLKPSNTLTTLAQVFPDEVTPEQQRINDIANTLVNQNQVVIPYRTAVWNNGQVVASTNQAPMIDLGDRKIVVIDINGFKMPFYCSSGHAGKKNVQAGKWYPIFGVDPETGWLNKGSQDQINNYYGSPILKAISEALDQKFGDVRNAPNIPRATMEGEHVDFINQNMTPVKNKQPDTITKFQESVQKTLAEIENRIAQLSGEAPDVQGDLLVETLLSQLVSTGVITADERANINVDNNIQFLTNPRNIQGRLSTIFTKDRVTGKWIFKDSNLSPKQATLIALVGFGKYRQIMNDPNLQGIITSFDINLENYILKKMQEHENDSCSFSRFGGM